MPVQDHVSQQTKRSERVGPKLVLNLASQPRRFVRSLRPIRISGFWHYFTSTSEDGGILKRKVEVSVSILHSLL